jgi:hypothetical protein
LPWVAHPKNLAQTAKALDSVDVADSTPIEIA